MIIKPFQLYDKKKTLLETSGLTAIDTIVSEKGISKVQLEQHLIQVHWTTDPSEIIHWQNICYLLPATMEQLRVTIGTVMAIYVCYLLTDL